MFDYTIRSRQIQKQKKKHLSQNCCGLAERIRRSNRHHPCQLGALTRYRPTQSSCPCQWAFRLVIRVLIPLLTRVSHWLSATQGTSTPDEYISCSAATSYRSLCMLPHCAYTYYEIRFQRIATHPRLLYEVEACVCMNVYRELYALTSR